MSTRETIIREALNLFSVKGYDAVSLRDIASRVGIKESSLYNHFKNKQDLFDSIVEWCATRNSEHFHDARLVGDDLAFRADAGTVGLYGAMSEDQFVETSGQVFVRFSRTRSRSSCAGCSPSSSTAAKNRRVCSGKFRSKPA
jgi:AcrR family transcriptional regulator